MVVALSGPVHRGKTTLLERALPLWKARGLACAGFLSPAVTEAGGRVAGYDLLEIAAGRRLPYLRRQGEAAAERIGPYVFVEATLERARAIVREAGPNGLLVVDEVGPLELMGRGLWPALAEALPKRDGPSLLVVREGLIEDLARRLGPLVVVDIRRPDVLARLEERVMEGAASDDRQG